MTAQVAGLNHSPRFHPGLRGAAVVETRQLLEVSAGMRTLVDDGGIVLVDGVPGLGKTFAADYALASLESETVWIAMPDRPKGKETTARLFFGLTGRRPNMRRSEYEILDDIRDYLIGRSMTIVIDEGQHLTQSSLRQLRHVYDWPESRLLLVLVGNDVDQAVQVRCPELYNRVERHVRFHPLPFAEMIAFARAMHEAFDNSSPEVLNRVWDAAGGLTRDWARILRTVQGIDESCAAGISMSSLNTALRIIGGETQGRSSSRKAGKTR